MGPYPSSVGTLTGAGGRLAQPEERLVYTEEVGGSNPSTPTTVPDRSPFMGVPSWARLAGGLVVTIAVLAAGVMPFGARLSAPGARPMLAEAWSTVRPDAYTSHLTLSTGRAEAAASITVAGGEVDIRVVRCTLDDCLPWLGRFAPYERLLETVAPGPWTITGRVPDLAGTYDVVGSVGEEQSFEVTRFEVLVP